jgi:FixJ family two-component response regulator
MSDVDSFASGQGRRILIVDDDEAVLKGLSEYFARLGYDVVRAATGQQGLDGFASQEPDVSILDLRLPDIDGMQILEIMRRKRALVILLTGYGDIATAVRAMQLGAENFLTKPVDLPHLVATVEHAIEKLDLRRENVRLRQLVPSTRRKVLQVVTALILIAAALLVGRFVGNVGTSHSAPPEIAPVKSEAPRTAPERADSRKLPGLAQPASSTAAPRR